MTLSIRQAALHDLSAVVRLLDQLSDAGVSRDARPVASAEHGAGAWAAILSQPGRAFLVAEEDEAIVGTADLFVVPNLTHAAAPIAYLENVVVDRDHRGSGVGLALFSEVERRAREGGCYKIQLISNAAREEAHRFYEAVGFEPSATGFRKYLDADG